MLLTVVLLGACAVPTSTSAPTLTIRAVATPQQLPELTEAAEAWHLLSSYGDQVWPGWGAARIPLLIRAGEFDLLVGHPSPPQEFGLLPDSTVADQPIYRYAGHLIPVPAATVWEVGGVWSVAVPTRAELQQAIDAKLGTGVVQLDTASYIRAIVHEAFHAYAMTTIHGDVPNFGADVDEGEMIQRLAALPDLDEQHAAEGQALVKALQASESLEVRAAAAEFLKLRQTRRARQDKEIAAYEQSIEWLEGLARYADIALMQLSARVGEVPGNPPSGKIWLDFHAALSSLASSPDGFRGRYYLLGAAQAFLLDRLMPDWKTRALSEKLALEGLLQEALR
jgi:hypothetical protein